MTSTLRDVPYLKTASVFNEETGELTIFALNRHMEEEMDLAVTARSFDGLSLTDAHELCDGDLQAINSRDEPERITRKPLEGVSVEGGTVSARLKPLSWNVIRLAAR